MYLLFPGDPTESKKVDYGFEDEAKAAKAVGFQYGIVSGGAFGEPLRIRGDIPEGDTEMMYRGWILREHDYMALDSLVTTRGKRLLVNGDAYSFLYRFPTWYQSLQGHPGVTPRSFWFPPTDVDAAVRALREEFGDNPVILKDYIKSRKHDWYDACFIRSAADEDEVRRVTKNFIDGQGPDLAGGLVYREFVKLKSIGLQLKTRTPLSKEFRFFVLNHRVVYASPYWSEGEYGDTKLPSEDIILPALLHINSPFFTVDVAEKEDGGHIIVEVGDGGSSGIPLDRHREFYEALWARYA